MVITLTTGAVIGVCSALGLFGVGKGVKAAADNSKANDVNEAAKNIIDAAKHKVDNARKTVHRWLVMLGNKKAFAYNEPLGHFLKSFKKLKNFTLSEAGLLNEASRTSKEKWDLSTLEEVHLTVTNMLGGAAGGLAAGGAMAFGAFGAVGTFASVATTGTAIADLVGVAATNATLAWLGGGALAAGGGGMAAGMAVLGGIVTGPALAIFGSVVGAKASAKLDEAKANKAKALELEAKLKLAQETCVGITNKAKLFTHIIGDVCEILLPQLDALDAVIKQCGTDYSKFPEDAKKVVVTAVSTVQLLKAVVDTPILKQNGSLDPAADKIVDVAQKYIAKAA